jgi:hypothetical protein
LILALGEEPNFVAEKLHIFEGVLDGLCFPAGATVCTREVILQVKHLVNSWPLSCNDKSLDFSGETRLFRFDESKSNSLNEPFPLFGSCHPRDDESKTCDEGKGPKQHTQSYQSICHYLFFVF